MSAFCRVDNANPIDDFGDFGRRERAGNGLVHGKGGTKSDNS